MIRDTATAALCMIDTINVNMNNERLTDENFREFIRNSIPGLYERAQHQANKHDPAVFNGRQLTPRRLVDLAKADENNN